MAKTRQLSDDVRRLLERAGYVWSEKDGDWSHPKSGRWLSGDVAASMTPEQVAEWIEAGVARRR